MELVVKKKDVYLRGVVEFVCGCSVGVKITLDGPLSSNLQPTLPLPCTEHSSIELADTIEALATQLGAYKQRLDRTAKKKKARKRRG
jgi:hypothetical protein